MTYVSKYWLRVDLGDGVLTPFAPGSVIEGFAQWPYAARRSHLQMGRVVVENRGGQAREITPAAAPAPSVGDSVVVKNSAPVAPAARPSGRVDPDAFRCADCPQRTFTNLRNLMIHRARSHGKK